MTERALPGEGRGRTCRGCAGFGWVHQLNNENVKKHKLCPLFSTIGTTLRDPVSNFESHQTLRAGF